jgi:DNA polymerase-3 subunit alpha
MSEPQFIHLSCHSSYSLLQAMPNMKQLAKTAAENNMPALAITDTQNMFGLVKASMAFTDAGVQPILGCQVSIQFEDEPSQDVHLLTLLVQNEQGYLNLCHLISEANLQSDTCPPQVSLELLKNHSEGLIALTGSAQEGALHDVLATQDDVLIQQRLSTLAAMFPDRLYVDIQRHGLEVERIAEPLLLAAASALDLPIVATNDARFMKKPQYEAFNVLMCIGESATVDTPNRKAYSAEHYFKSQEQMVKLFEDLPTAIENTVAIAKRCGYWPKIKSAKEMYMPQWPIAEGEPNVETQLRQEAEAGLEKRLQESVLTPETTADEEDAIRKQYNDRLNYEIGIIEEMGYVGYFLITSDFIKWSKANDIPVGPGRGSGAGSLVAWVMEITDLDPIRWDLYFERFLNPDRVSLPDFDIDFCVERREEVINYVRQKYGAESVTQIITFGTLKARACIRDVGRVLQMPFGQVGQIAAFIPDGQNPPPIQKVLDEDERFRTMYQTDEDVKRLIDIALELEGCYRHASTHAAGVHIADRPVRQVAPLFKDHKTGQAITALDWVDAELAGLVKFDFLGLKNLTIVNETAKLIRASEKPDFDIREAGFHDEETLKMLQAGHTVGVFQVESRGMTDYVKKIVPDKFDYLSDVIALYRPGPLGSGMTDDFIECRHGRKEPNYPHPVLEPILKNTFGVPVYQEQVMRMAQELAGYSLGNADMLRRAMGKKKPAEMAKHRELFTNGSKERHNVDSEQSNYIFDLMANFAGYGFNKAHTVAYALVAWQTAYLKAHYPRQFMAASMTQDRGNQERLAVYVRECRRVGIKVLAPDIAKSDVMFKLEGDKSIRYALTAIKGAGSDAMQAIVDEREANGDYADLLDLFGRIEPRYLTKRQLEALTFAGVFDSLEPNRAKIIANSELLLAHGHAAFEAKNSNQIGLFGGGSEAESEAMTPTLSDNIENWDSFTQLDKELGVFGFYLQGHPLDAYAQQLARRTDLVPVNGLADRALGGDKTALVAALPQSRREVKTKSGNRLAILTISDPTGLEEVVMYPEAYAAAGGRDMELNVPYMFEFELRADGERVRMSVQRMTPLAQVLDNDKTIILDIKEFSKINKLHDIINDIPEGRSRCQIKFNQPEFGEFMVKLPNPIQMNPRAEEQMRNLGIQIN